MIVETKFLDIGPFTTIKGKTIPQVTLAYETYGTLSPAKDNAVLVFHALSGSQHAAGFNPAVPGVGDRWTDEMQEGWWDGFIGPGKAVDTDRYFVICVNYLGGCYGTTGPASVDPTTGRPYGSSFPHVTMTDVVDTQMRLLDHLGIDRLHACVGGSIGGMMCAVLATKYPERVEVVIPVAAGFEVTSLQVLHNFEQMFAIVTDPEFKGGDYYPGPGPELGLALARMIGHKTFVSLTTLKERARDEIVQFEDIGGYRVGHPLESYMLHQGQKFVKRFDANSYLRIMNMWQHFDLAGEVGADSVDQLLTRCRNQRWQVLTIDSDVCYYPEEQADMVARLKRAGVPVRWHTVHSEKGHDSFLIEPHLYTAILREALAGW
ncbi:MAG: homoserine O-acetyltransferase [Acidimicrobiia bacterium]|nr:MAG: homoserine O-acetyltransferase [Acidimicrobiia bacterium]